MFTACFLCPRWLPFSSVLWDCVCYSSQNDPADNQMPVQRNKSVPDYTLLKTGFSMCIYKKPYEFDIFREQIENVIFT